MLFNDYKYISNFKPYGNAYKIRINKNLIRGLFIFLCLITPFTNWLIIGTKKLIKKDIIIIKRF